MKPEELRGMFWQAIAPRVEPFDQGGVDECPKNFSSLMGSPLLNSRYD
jgi:hypothetical protein